MKVLKQTISPETVLLLYTTKHKHVKI